MNTSTIHYPTKTELGRLEIHGQDETGRMRVYNYDIPENKFDELMREQGVLTNERAVSILNVNK